MRYKLHNTSIKAWDAMLEAIKLAQKSIYIEMYIFDADTAGSHDFIGELMRKSKQGVKVILVADDYGSRSLKKISHKLKEAGIDFIFFSHWLRGIHRKVLIIDEEISFIGGVNIGKRFKAWHDLTLELKGRISKKILKSFAYTYAMSGGKNKSILKYKDKKMATKFRFWLVEHWPSKNIYTLKDLYAQKIMQAQHIIKIATPYFLPPRWLIALLDNASKRGVRVEIIIPNKTEYPIADRINFYYMNKLHSMGIKFFVTNEMNHAKLLEIDEKEGIIGSQNIDFYSFRLNAEVGVFFYEKKLLKELSETIEKWKTNSTKFEPKMYRMQPIDYLISALIRIFNPIL